MEPEGALKKLSAARPPAWAWRGGDCVHDLCWAPHGHTLAAVTLAGEVVLLEGTTGKPRWRIADAHPGGALWCAFHPTEPLLATGGQDGSVKLWDANKGLPIRVLFEDKKKWAEHGAWSADGSALAAAAGKEISFWSLDGKPLGKTPPQKATLSCLAWHPEENRLLVGAYGGLSVWEPGNETPLESRALPTAVLAAAWRPGANGDDWVAAGTADASVETWRVGTEEALRMGGYEGKVRALAWHPGGDHLTTGGGLNVVCWDFRGEGPAGSTPQEWIGHSEPITAAAAHPADPQRAASAGRDRLIFIWKLGTDDPTTMRAVPESVPHLLAWKPDGTLLAAGCEGGEVLGFKIGN